MEPFKGIEVLELGGIGPMPSRGMCALNIKRGRIQVWRTICAASATQKGSGMPNVDTTKLRIQTPRDIRPAAVYFRNAVLALADLRIACTENIAGREPMRDAEGSLLATSVFGWDTSSVQWWKDPRFILKTPAAEACRIRSLPFWANRHGAWDEQGARILNDFDFAAYFKRIVSLSANIVVPVHLPFSQIGLATLSCISNDRDDLSLELSKHFADLYLLSNLFITGYADLSRNRKWLPERCKLTRLEVNCLRWAGRGKTDDEIATIMGRARPTIRFHLQNAASKLGALNRSQAVFYAGQLGYLSSTSRAHLKATSSP